MEETTAQEYLTGEELEAEAEPDRSPPASAQEQASVTELKAQIQALKAQLASAQPVAVPPPPPKTPSLFNVGVTPKVSAADWTKLKQLAGSPPPRVGATETRRSLPATTQMAQFETDYAEEEREVAEPGVAGLELPAQIQSADPAQQLMFLQMQQNAVLLQKLVTKHSDPVLGLCQAAAPRTAAEEAAQESKYAWPGRCFYGQCKILPKLPTQLGPIC